MAPSRTGPDVDSSDSDHTAYLQVVEDEEEGLCGEPLVELYSVGVGRWHLVVERQGGARVPHQVLPVTPTQREC